jgi:hypothetical protein
LCDIRIPHFLGNRLTDGGEVSLTHRPRSTPQKHFLVPISVRGRVNSRAIVWLDGFGKLKNSSDLIGTRKRDLAACSKMPQPTYAFPYFYCRNEINFKYSVLERLITHNKGSY